MGSNVTSPANPFRFGGLALGEAFADREAELQELKADLLNGQDVVIFAPRRYGKSSLIWRTMQGLESAGVKVAYVNLMTTPTRERLAEKLAAAIYGRLASSAARSRERALAPFRGLRISPTITVDPGDGTYSFSFGVGHATADVDATLERLLELPAELAAAQGERVALVLDEFQEVETIDPRLPRLMRTIFEQHPEVGRAYLGSRRHMMERLFNDENEPFWRSAKKLELDVIAPERFRRFIGERFRATRKDAGEDVVEELLARTDGHPYATQELAYFLWEETPFDDVAGRPQLAAALRAVLRSEYAHFQVRWDQASSAQKVVLRALAGEPGRPLSSAYRTRHELPAPSTVQTALEVLVERELVLRRARGEYRISEPFLAEWILALDREPGAEG